MGSHKKKHNRKRSASSSSSEDEEDKMKLSRTKHESSSKKKKILKKKRTPSTSSDSSSSSSPSDSSSSSSSTESSEEERRRLKKEKKKMKRLKMKIEAKKKEIVAHTVNNDKKGKSKSKVSESSDIPLHLMEKSKLMAPMTKDEWDKRQSVVKRVYDESSGRHRLIKGDGEVIDEIVSRDRHKAINQQATKGDGDFFQSKTTGHLKK